MTVVAPMVALAMEMVVTVMIAMVAASVAVQVAVLVAAPNSRHASMRMLVCEAAAAAHNKLHLPSTAG